MKTRIVLSRDELADMIAAVCEYNDRPVDTISFLGADGQPLQDVSVELTCEMAGLRIRIAPELPGLGRFHEQLDKALA